MSIDGVRDLDFFGAISFSIGRSKVRLPLMVCCLLWAGTLLTGCTAGQAPGRSASTPPSQLTPEQKMEDFRYMFRVIRDNYPFHWVKARTDGFDWVAHEEEFESWVSATRDDREFAQVMRKLVTLLNNSHTHICNPGEFSGFERMGGLWREEARKTTSERVDYWWRMCGGPSYGTAFQGSSLTEEPFVARYSGGSYVVVDVWPGSGLHQEAGEGGRSSGLAGVVPGSVVVSVDGQEVDEYVSSLYGTLVLKYDPLRKKLYLPVLTLNPDVAQYGAEDGHRPAEECREAEVVFRSPSGETLEVKVSREVPAWSSRFVWPPLYTGEYRTDNIYCAVIDGSVAYVQVRSMKSEFSRDMAVLKTFMTEARSLPSLVIDIRGNGGGDDRYWREMVRILATNEVNAELAVTWRSDDFVRRFMEHKGLLALPAKNKQTLMSDMRPATREILPGEILGEAFDEPRVFRLTLRPAGKQGYTGKIFLLVDDYVYSSAESFAAFCKASKWATLVGSVTGGDGIGVDPAVVALPNSGMLIRFSSVMGLHSDFAADEEFHTVPDVIVEMPPDDLARYAALREGLVRPDPSWDTVLRECLKLAAAQGR